VHRLTVAAAVVLACLAPVAARAQALDLPGGAGGVGPVGRAGVGVVAADDGSALWLNPAGLARRGGWRAQLGLTWHGRGGRFDTAEEFGAAPAQPRLQGASTRVPTLALEGGLGERIVIGVAWLEPTDARFAWPTPDPLRFDRMNDDKARYPGRYGGTALRLERRGAGAGVSVRALPWLAVGVSAWALRVDLAEARTVWGGQGVAGAVPNLGPAYDMPLALDAHDDLVPGAALGVIVAPLDAPIELGLSLSWSDDAALAGAPSLGPSRDVVGSSSDRLVRAEVAGDATARVTLPGALVVRAGVRFMAERFTVELDGELGFADDAAPAWRIEGVRVVAYDGPSAELDAAPLGARLTPPLALRAATDVDVVPGFLVLSLGWAWTRAAVSSAALSPALPSLDAHVVALGAQAQSGGATLTLGLAHAFGLAADAEGGSTVLAPLAAGDAPAAAGRYDTSATTVALGVEIAW
jgi:hypothetical protein